MKSTRFSLLVIVFLLFTIVAVAQDYELTKQDSIVKNSWIVGIGFNVVDDAGSEFTNIFNVKDNWNAVPFPSRLSIGRYFENGLGLEAIGSYNKYKEGKIVDNTVNTQDINYYAIDLRASYDLNKIIGHTGFFDPYVGLGLGFTDANNQGRGTYNAIFGFRTWFNDRIGLDFNSTGKWAMSTENASNHIQHAVGIVYQFKMKKGLSKKSEEKLALLKEIEEEKKRLQDSTTWANLIAKEAKELAEKLKKEEAERIAKEKALSKTKKDVDQNLVGKIKSLGYVYFDLNSSYLNTKETNLLDNLINILESNSNIDIKIMAFCDSRESNTYNLWLSEKRLERTVYYLVKNGIASTRIQGEAMGEANLTNECDDTIYCSEEKHSKNRRVEFSITK